jgi:hypothetical protein
MVRRDRAFHPAMHLDVRRRSRTTARRRGQAPTRRPRPPELDGIPRGSAATSPSSRDRSGGHIEPMALDRRMLPRRPKGILGFQGSSWGPRSRGVECARRRAARAYLVGGHISHAAAAPRDALGASSCEGRMGHGPWQRGGVDVCLHLGTPANDRPPRSAPPSCMLLHCRDGRRSRGRVCAARHPLRAVPLSRRMAARVRKASAPPSRSRTRKLDGRPGPVATASTRAAWPAPRSAEARRFACARSAALVVRPPREVPARCRSVFAASSTSRVRRSRGSSRAPSRPPRPCR